MQGTPHQEDKPLHHLLLITPLAPLPVSVQPKDSLLIEAIAQPLPEQVLLLFCQARRILKIKGEGNLGVDLIDMLTTLTATPGIREK